MVEIEVKVPESLLLGFLSKATAEIRRQCGIPQRTSVTPVTPEGCTPTLFDQPQDSLGDIQRKLLKIQVACLNETVEAYNENAATNKEDGSVIPMTVPIVQAQLKRVQSGGSDQTANIQIQNTAKDLNETARLAFANLVLYSEGLQLVSSHKSPRSLKTSGNLEKSDILQFIGLCDVCWKLDNVKSFLFDFDFNSGDSGLSRSLQAIQFLFPDIETKSPGSQPDAADSLRFPQQRLEFVHGLFLKAIGFDPDYAYTQLREMLFDPKPNSTNSLDSELTNRFHIMVQHSKSILTSATLHIQERQLLQLNDQKEGGVTRVVSVTHSEKVVEFDGEDDKEEEVEPSKINSGHADVGVKLESMDHGMDEHDQWMQRQKELQMARSAGRLQQEILGELLTMRDEDRARVLEEARNASQELVSRLANITLDPSDDGSDSGPTADMIVAKRVEVLQSLDMKSQRLLLMEKLWSAMLADNGGKPPNVHPVSQSEY